MSSFLPVPLAVLGTALLSSAAMGVAPTPVVKIDSAVFVEHATESSRVLQPADQLRRGDRVVTVVSWRRQPGGGTFTVTNPLPRTLQFQGSADQSEEVSVDGGRHWGHLDQLRIGNRQATPEDVTHVRWHIATPAPTGRIAYSAIVR